jgi:hypothetical protein
VPNWMRLGVVRVFVVIPEDNHESQGLDWAIFNGTECTVELEHESDGNVRIQLNPERPPTQG